MSKNAVRLQGKRQAEENIYNIDDNGEITVEIKMGKESREIIDVP